MDVSSHYTADARAVGDSDRRMLSAALERLPLEFRETLVLRELEGLSYGEIARVTGVPVGTVMSRLARARERMRHMLKRSA